MSELTLTQSLDPHFYPETCPGRESEFARIQQEIERSAQKGNFLYVYGVPGTGKTLVVNQVLARFSDRRIISMNGSNLLEDPYSRFWHAYQGETITASLAKQKLQESGCDYGLILLIDEVDLLTSHKDAFSLLYMLCDDWIPRRKVTVVAIANESELFSSFPEKIRQKFESRVQFRLRFTLYQEKQLVAILGQRIEVDRYFLPDSVKFACKSRDARSLLTLCWKALQTWSNDTPITCQHMRKVAEQMASEQAQIYPQLSEYEVDVLKCLLNGFDQERTPSLCEAWKCFQDTYRYTELTYDMFLSIFVSLVRAGVLALISSPEQGMYQRFRFQACFHSHDTSFLNYLKQE